MATDKVKVKEIFHEIAKKAGLPDDQAKAWLATLDNEQLQNALSEVVMTRSDYSRAMDEVTRTREQAAAEKTKYEATHNEQVVWYANNKRALDEYPTLKKQLEAYRTLYGELDGAGAGTGASADADKPYATRDDVAQATQRLWDLQEQLMEVQDHYFNTFGKPISTARYKELKAAAMRDENKMRPLREVYRDFIQPDVDAKRETEIQERIAKATAEARAEERAKRTFPNEGNQIPDEEVSPLYRSRPEKVEVDERALQQEFIKGLYEPATAT